MGDQRTTEGSVAASIKAELESLHHFSPYHFIYRAPEHLRQVNEKAYRPMVVSIGPFYYGQPHLQAMQVQKMRYLKGFLKRGCHDTLEQCIRFVVKHEHNARNCYAEEFRNISSKDFARMLLLDAAFIIELFYRVASGSSEAVEQNINLSFCQLSQDLILEENQVPFFILKRLYDLACPTPSSNHPHHTLIQLVSTCIPNIWNFENGTANQKIMKASTTTEFKHLVDCLRFCYLPSTTPGRMPPPVYCNYQKPEMPKFSARELISAGVKFKAFESDNLFDIGFDREKGELKIPKFTVHDGTEVVFRSITLLEQCHYDYNPYFIHYLVFLDRLIDTAKDVQILVDNDIMYNCLGSNEEATILFNNLVKNVPVGCCSNHFCYHDLSKELNEYAKSRKNKWMAILKRKYLDNPWAVISVISAVVLLVLTLLQTIAAFTSQT